jgi:Zn-dependent protease with chaperone function
VTARDSPALAALVEETRRALRSPRIHRTIVDDAFNASVRQVSRLAIFWPRNTLAIGYPLLISLSPEQLRAVVAHELAHVFHAHGRVAAWLYRTRLSWLRLATTLKERGSVPILVRWFVASYVPRLEARSAAIAREQELAADRVAAAIAGSRIAADTLEAIELGTCRLEKVFWRAVFDSVESREEPPRPFAQMQTKFDALANDGSLADLLDTLLASATESYDTHPSLRDRLLALDEAPRVPDRADRKAGEVYLGPRLQAVAAALDDEWQKTHGDEWRERHAEIRNAHRRLAEFEAQTSLTAQATFERASLLEDLGRDDDAFAAYQAAVGMDSTHGRAALAVGRMLVWRGDDAGVALIERSMELDNGLVPEACRLLVGHYQQRGRPAEAQRYRARATRHATQTAIETTERTTASALDRLAPHGMEGSELEPLVTALKREREVRQALLARKHLRHSDGSLLVLGLVADDIATNELVSRIRAARLLPADAHVVLLDRDQRALQSALEAVQGSRLYTRSRVST